MNDIHQRYPERRLPPFHAIRAFEAAARHVSFQRAADELHLTPSAVSHQVRALEDFLGVRLFSRLGRRVALTPEGASYLAPIGRALNEMVAATERIRGAKAIVSLTMSVAPTFATTWLVPRLPGFQQAHPDIEVRVSTSIELVDLSRSDVDIGIRWGPGHWPGLRSHYLMAEELLPVCSPSLLTGEKPLRRPDDLRDATLLHVMPKIGEWRNWLSVAGVTVVDPERGPKFQHAGLALEAATAGLGVAMGDRRQVKRYLERGSLVAPFDVELPSEHAYYLVYPNERAKNAKVDAFREWLLREVATEGSLSPATRETTQ